MHHLACSGGRFAQGLRRSAVRKLCVSGSGVGANKTTPSAARSSLVFKRSGGGAPGPARHSAPCAAGKVRSWRTAFQQFGLLDQLEKRSCITSRVSSGQRVRFERKRTAPPRARRKAFSSRAAAIREDRRTSRPDLSKNKVCQDLFALRRAGNLSSHQTPASAGCGRPSSPLKPFQRFRWDAASAQIVRLTYHLFLNRGMTPPSRENR